MPYREMNGFSSPYLLRPKGRTTLVPFAIDLQMFQNSPDYLNFLIWVKYHKKESLKPA